MQQLTGVVGSIVDKARSLVHLGASTDTRRDAFSQEFDQHPPYQEASAEERATFAREVVEPELRRRAAAVQQAGQPGSQPAASTEATDAFDRAYRVATQMGLAEKGRTYHDYLEPDAT